MKKGKKIVMKVSIHRMFQAENTVPALEKRNTTKLTRMGGHHNEKCLQFLTVREGLSKKL